MLDKKDFINYGYYIVDLDEKSLSSVKNEITKIKNDKDKANSISDVVDGHVSGTYSLKDSLYDLENLVTPYFIEYDKHYNYINANYSVLTDNLNFVMNDAWVSFQKKFEFNPAHTHPGLISFVIWTDIPYDRQEENQLSPGAPKTNKSGSFTMYYTDILGNVKTEDILLDKTFNNKMILFPSKIKHSVAPFYSSNSTRVSVAGNFFFEIKGVKNV